MSLIEDDEAITERYGSTPPPSLIPSVNPRKESDTLRSIPLESKLDVPDLTPFLLRISALGAIIALSANLSWFNTIGLFLAILVLVFTARYS